MTAVPRERPASRIRRPAVVEHVDSPRSTSDGRTISPAAPAATAPPELQTTRSASAGCFVLLRTWVGRPAPIIAT